MLFSLPTFSLLGMLVSNALILAAPVPTVGALENYYSQAASAATPCAVPNGKKAKRCGSGFDPRGKATIEIPEYILEYFMAYMAPSLQKNTALFYSVSKNPKFTRGMIEKYASDHHLHSLWTMVDSTRIPKAGASEVEVGLYWRAASTAFAEMARGTIYLLMEAGAVKSPDPMWNNVEWPIVQRRMKEGKITAVKVLRDGKGYTDIATQSETYVHSE